MLQNRTLEDLKLTLSAVTQAREAMQEVMDRTFAAACEREQPQTQEELKRLYSKVATSKEVQNEFQKLLTLYSCIGAQSSEYIEALEAA